MGDLLAGILRVVGQDDLFKKADVAEGSQFFEDLVAEVSAGMAQGKSLAPYNNLKIYR
jgi:hypothetical protein